MITVSNWGQFVTGIVSASVNNVNFWILNVASHDMIKCESKNIHKCSCKNKIYFNSNCLINYSNDLLTLPALSSVSLSVLLSARFHYYYYFYLLTFILLLKTIDEKSSFTMESRNNNSTTTH